jgi:hypothetical protein
MSENNYDKAKSSSDEVLSLIDSLKGSSLINSVVGGIENFSLSGFNSSNNTDAGIGLLNNSDPIIGIDQNVTQSDLNNTAILMLNSDNASITNNMGSTQSLLIFPYPMSIQSKDYVPLFSSIPFKISNGIILTKLPCDNNNKPILQIVGSSADNNFFLINLNLIANLSSAGSMCMYQSLIPDDLSNLLYSHTLTTIYLYNSLNIQLEVPTTTSIFIGIHKLTV